MAVSGLITPRQLYDALVASQDDLLLDLDPYSEGERIEIRGYLDLTDLADHLNGLGAPATK